MLPEETTLEEFEAELEAEADDEDLGTNVSDGVERET